MGRNGLAIILLAVGALVTAFLVGPDRADGSTAVAERSPAVKGSNKVIETRVVGRTVQGRKIVAYRKGTPDAARTVVLLGQMHGDERAGVTTARYIVRHVPVSLDADVWIIPTMNPDGLAHHTRTNAHGVDLNRNWPMNWRRSSRGITYSGPRAASERETRAMMRFLADVEPDFMSSIHQPYGEVGYYRDKPVAFQRRLARGLGLPLRGIGIGGPSGPPHGHGHGPGHLQPGGRDNAPTLTGWYNAHYPGTAMTVEFGAHPSMSFVTHRAGHALVDASLAGGGR